MMRDEIGYNGIFGRDERIRTSDPHTPSVMRYQAALRPDRPFRAGEAPSAALLAMQAAMGICRCFFRRA